MGVHRSQLPVGTLCDPRLRPALRTQRQRKIDKSEVLRKNKIWVACQTDDDLPYVLKYSGDDMLVIGTDYGHNDTSSEILALRKLKEDGRFRRRW